MRLVLAGLGTFPAMLLMGGLGANLAQQERNAILNHQGTRQLENGTGFDLAWLPFGLQLRAAVPVNIAINLQRVEAGVAIHLLRYDYQSEQDKVPTSDELALKLRLPGNFSSAEVFSPGEPPQLRLEVSDDLHRLGLKNVPLYSIVLLKEQPTSLL